MRVPNPLGIADFAHQSDETVALFSPELVCFSARRARDVDGHWTVYREEAI